MNTITASRHAEQRAHQRLGWNRRALARMLPRIVKTGIHLGGCQGLFSAYLAERVSDGRYECRVFGDHLYVFAHRPGGDLILVTLYLVPLAVRRYLPHIRSKKHPLAA